MELSFLVSVLIWLWWAYIWDFDFLINADHLRFIPHKFSRDNEDTENVISSIGFKYRKKPQWVIDEIIELKAINPHLTVRKLMETFNRLYCEKRQMTVGRTFVGKTLQRHQYKIEVLRKKIKNRRPAKVAKNLCWGVDFN